MTCSWCCNPPPNAWIYRERRYVAPDVCAYLHQGNLFFKRSIDASITTNMADLSGTTTFYGTGSFPIRWYDRATTSSVICSSNDMMYYSTTGKINDGGVCSFPQVGVSAFTIGHEVNSEEHFKFLYFNGEGSTCSGPLPVYAPCDTVRTITATTDRYDSVGGCADSSENGNYSVITYSEQLNVASLAGEALSLLQSKSFSPFEVNGNTSVGLTGHVPMGGSLYPGTATAPQFAFEEYKWKFIFHEPYNGTKKSYHVLWVETYITGSGANVHSASITEGGTYRPNVYFSNAPVGGRTARGIAEMTNSGSVSSIRILDGGAGYISPPTVTLTPANNGGVSSTAWTASLSSGSVVSVTGGVGGNYLPILSFSPNGGTRPVASASLDRFGNVNDIYFVSTGSKYFAPATLSITSRVVTTGVTPGVSKAPHVVLWHGDETYVRSASWDGVLPAAYTGSANIQHIASQSLFPSIPPSGSSMYLSTYKPISSGSGFYYVGNVIQRVYPIQ